MVIDAFAHRKLMEVISANENWLAMRKETRHIPHSFYAIPEFLHMTLSSHAKRGKPLETEGRKLQKD